MRLLRCGRGKSLLLGTLFLLLSLFGGHASADPLDTWHWRNPTPTGRRLFSLAYGDGLFVAVGEAATIITSPDGTSWTDRNTGSDLAATLTSIAYGNGLFVAVGEGLNVTSRDGITWTPSRTGPFVLRSVAYGNGMFMAIGSNMGTTDSVIAVSYNGLTWTTSSAGFQISPLSHQLRYANGKFIVCTETGIMVFDGRTWPPANLQRDFGDVAYGNGIYVAVGMGQVATSTDGANWTAQPDFPQDVDLMSVTHGNGIFVALGRQLANPPRYSDFLAATSTDGIIWTIHSSDNLDGNPFDPRAGYNEPVIQVAYGKNIFAAVGANSICTSADGALWTLRTTGLVSGAADEAGYNGQGAIIQSDPLTSPAPPAPPPGPFPSPSPPPAPVKPDESEHHGSGCLIVITACGSYLEPHVVVLRRFRDNYLLRGPFGIAFVRFYYRYSPPVAYFIRDHDTLRLVTRLVLTPLVYGVKYCYLAPLTLLIGIPMRLRIKRRAAREDNMEGHQEVTTRVSQVASPAPGQPSI